MRTRFVKLQRITEELLDLRHDLLTSSGQCPQCGSFRSSSIEEAEAARQIIAILEAVRFMQGQAWAQEVR